jgi:hypothetical protein
MRQSRMWNDRWLADYGLHARTKAPWLLALELLPNLLEVTWLEFLLGLLIEIIFFFSHQDELAIRTPGPRCRAIRTSTPSSNRWRASRPLFTRRRRLLERKRRADLAIVAAGNSGQPCAT